MNSESPTDVKTSAGSGARRSALKMALALGALLITAVALVLFFAVKSDQTVAWLSPAQFSRATHPGPLTRIKLQITRSMGPLSQLFHRRRMQVNVICKFLAFPAQTPEKTGLPAAAATNSDGTRIWVLSAEQLTTFRERLSLAGAPPLHEPWITTLDGSRAQIYAGGSPPAGTNEGFPTSSVIVTPKLIRNSFRLTVGITATMLVPSTNPPVFDVRTNISTGFSVFANNNGGIVLMSSATNSEGRNYGIIMSPIALDAAGHPLKL